MVTLKNYVDFITSLTEMDEIGQGRFILPSVMEFKLEMVNHCELHKEVKKLKEQEIIKDELVEPFEVEIMGVSLNFIHDGYED